MATTTTSTLSNNVAAALNRALRLKLAGEVAFARNAVLNNSIQHQNGRDAQVGDPVKFTLYNRLPTATSALSETPNSEVASSITNSQVSITLREQGNFVESTRKLNTLSFRDIQPVEGELIAENASRSVDQYAMEVVEAEAGGAYNTYVGNTAKSGIDNTDVLTASVVRQTYAKLQSAGARKVTSDGGAYYLMFVHPTQAYSLKNEASGNTFREASLYANPSQILRGEIGAFEGFRFIETSANKVDFKAGASIASTTVAASAVAGATTLTLTSATNFTTTGSILNVTVGSDEWALDVTGISSTTVTVNRAIRLNGFYYPSADGAGLPVALSGGEAIVEKHAVVSAYAIGADALGYAYAVQPEIIPTVKDDPYNRVSRLAWYALHGIGIVNKGAQHKVYTGSASGIGLNY